MEKSKSRVIVIGGTGRLGRRFVKASLAHNHPTYVLYRPQAVHDIEKVDLLTSFKQSGANLIQCSLDDHENLVAALKQVDVVISALPGTMGRNDIIQQLKIVDAIKEAGNIKRFIPSEFGIDPEKISSIGPPCQTFIDKIKVRRAIEMASVPFTYISANCFAGFFLGGLGVITQGYIPSTQSVCLYGEGNIKVVWVDEDDVATYTIKAMDDSRTLNKMIYIRPPANILSQREVVEIWERLLGIPLVKTQISAEDWLKTMEGKPLLTQLIVSRGYQIFYEGCTVNFEIGMDREASELYPEVKYNTVESFLKRYI